MIKAIQGTGFLGGHSHNLLVQLSVGLLFISLGNAPLCTSLRMVLSALSSSSTLRGLRFMFSVRCAMLHLWEAMPFYPCLVLDGVSKQWILNRYAANLMCRKHGHIRIAEITAFARRKE